jgi:hypothetical protein
VRLRFFNSQFENIQFFNIVGDKKNASSKGTGSKSSKTTKGAGQAKQTSSEPPAKKQKLTSAHTTGVYFSTGVCLQLAKLRF